MFKKILSILSLIYLSTLSVNADFFHKKNEYKTSECHTRFNNFHGECTSPSSCDGAIYNNFCPGLSKCCIEDIKNSPIFYWRYVSYSDFERLFPELSKTRTNTLFPWYNNAISDILNNTHNNKKCHIISAYTAQIGHESAGLNLFEELASGEEYEGRCKSLGNCEDGDGKKFKGRGPIQITGKTNYKKLSEYLQEDLVNNPDLLTMPSYGFSGSVWYWKENDLNKYCTGNKDDFIKLTKAINGGENGLSDRLERWVNAKKILYC